MSQQYTPQQIAALDAHLAAVVRVLPHRPWRPSDPPVLPVSCNRGVWRKDTLEPCGAPLVKAMFTIGRCEAHKNEWPKKGAVWQ